MNEEEENKKISQRMEELKAQGININPIFSNMDYQGNYYFMQEQLDGTWKSWYETKRLKK